MQTSSRRESRSKAATPAQAVCAAARKMLNSQPCHVPDGALPRNQLPIAREILALPNFSVNANQCLVECLGQRPSGEFWGVAPGTRYKLPVKLRHRYVGLYNPMLDVQSPLATISLLIQTAWNCFESSSYSIPASHA